MGDHGAITVMAHLSREIERSNVLKRGRAFVFLLLLSFVTAFVFVFAIICRIMAISIDFYAPFP